MTLKQSTTLRQARAVATVSDLGGAALIEVRDGTRPADPQAAATGTVLGTFTSGSPFAPAPVAGVITANPIADILPVANGTATWARIYTSGAVSKIDIDVTITGGGGDLQFPSPVFALGTAQRIGSLVLTEAQA